MGEEVDPTAGNGEEVIPVVADGTDQAALINHVLATSSATVFRLPPGNFAIGANIYVPPGKMLVGAGQDETVLNLLPTLDPINDNRTIVLGDGAGLAQLTLDGDKIGLGLGASQRVHGVVGQGVGFLVENVAVRNMSGYAFWANGNDEPDKPSASGIFRDSYAENSSVLFETTDADGVLFERVVGAAGDGDIPMESAFHPAANSRNITFLDSAYVGVAPSVDVLANDGDQWGIVFERVHGVTTGPSAAVYLTGTGRNQVTMIDSSFVAVQNNALHLYDADLLAVGTSFESTRIAVVLDSRSTAHFVESQAVADGDPDYEGAAYGIYAEGQVLWEGGEIAASGSSGSSAYVGAVTQVGAHVVTQGVEQSAPGEHNVVAGGPEADILEGTNDDDILYSREVSPAWASPFIANLFIAPRLDTSDEADTLSGGAGDDRLFAGFGDTVDGGSGSDTLLISFQGAPEGVAADFRAMAGGAPVTIGGATISGVEALEWLEGSEHDDVLALPEASPDYAPIFGQGGNDVILGGDRDDRLFGGDGDDRLNGSGGIDAFDGGGQEGAGFGDSIDFFDLRATAGVVADLRTGIIANDGFGHQETMAGIESLVGDTAFADIFFGDESANRLSAGLGDILHGFGGDDLLQLSAAAATVDGGDGRDRLELGARSGVYRPDSDGDGEAEAGPVMTAGYEVDLGAGTIRDGYGNEGTVAGIEDLVGSELDDQLRGSEADNRIEGGGGDDLIDGGSNDSLFGGDGDDTLRWGGDALIDGGPGTDLLRMEQDGSNAVTAELSDPEVESVLLGTRVTGVERLYFSSGSGDDRLTGGAREDELIGNGGDDVISGGAGNDTLSGGEGSDQLSGGAGDDFIDGGEGVDEIYGGDDDDIIRVGGVEGGYLDGGPGNDEVSGSSGADTLVGGAGNDLLTGEGGDDSMSGGTGDDFYIVDSAGDSIVENAGEGADQVQTGLAAYGLAANVETLSTPSISSTLARDFRGNAGNNQISAAAGNDLLRLDDGGDDVALGYDGDDILYFGDAFSPADLAGGGSGRDALILQGNYITILSETNLMSIESLSLQSGAQTRWGDTDNNFYDYDITTVDPNVPAGVQLIVNGQSLRVGEDLAFDGSAETDGRFLVYAGHGVDALTGGAGNDVFFFEGTRWGEDDTVDGGAGRDAVIISAGSGVNRFEFGESSFTSIESISVNARFASDPGQKPSYELVLANGNVAAGGSLIVNGSSLADPGQFVSVDGSAVTGGTLSLFGGAGDDTLIGGAGADLLHGARGGDSLTGGGGADVFQFRDSPESAAEHPDVILDFESGIDSIDLHLIDADALAEGDQAFSWIGSEAFSGAAGQLRAYQSDGSWFVEGDTDGDGNADLVIAVQAGTAPLVQDDFNF